MAKPFQIYKIGADVTFEDLGDRTITTTTPGIDISDEYDLEFLRDSEEIRAKIVAGEAGVIFDGVDITTGALWDSNVVDFNNAQVAQNASDIAANSAAIAGLDLTGKKTFTWKVEKKKKIKDDQDLENGGSVTNKTPLVPPFNCTLYAAAVQSKQGENADYSIDIVVDGNTGAPLQSIPVVAADQDSKILTFSQDVDTTNEVRVRAIHDDDIENLVVHIFGVERS